MDMLERLGLTAQGPWLMQGWFPGRSLDLAAAFAGSGGLGVVRAPAFPAEGELESLLERAKGAGLDLKGLRDRFKEAVELARQRKAAFLAHHADLPTSLREILRSAELPRLGFVSTPDQAEACAQDGSNALVVEEGAGLRERLSEIFRRTGLPLLAETGRDARADLELLNLEGVRGFQVRSARWLKAAGLNRNSTLPDGLLGQGAKPLPRLKIRHLELDYPVVQGGMGVGVSWEGLAGAVAKSGCLGIISAIGTGNRYPELATQRLGRPDGADNMHHDEALTRIIQEALRRSEGRGAVGVNILCAIQGYERVVRTSVAAGAQVIISGAGLPLGLPGLVEGHEVALVPIVSSARALGLICKTWQRKYNRLPDAVVLEGPESGGHQGFSAEQIPDPAFALEALLGPVLEERDRWGSFPVIVAGGVWDRADIDRFLALGASGVQMATRFIGTHECDASPTFKDVLLRARREDIQLVHSPVGLPGRAVVGSLQAAVAEGTAPKIRCVSDCVTPCNHGVGALKAGYCIADRLEDARQGQRDTGLFFSGSNGWKLRDLMPVRELVAEITQDF